MVTQEERRDPPKPRGNLSQLPPSKSQTGNQAMKNCHFLIAPSCLVTRSQAGTLHRAGKVPKVKTTMQTSALLQSLPPTFWLTSAWRKDSEGNSLRPVGVTERGSTSTGDLQLGSLIAVAILIELICAVKLYHLFVALFQGLSSIIHKGNSRNCAYYFLLGGPRTTTYTVFLYSLFIRLKTHSHCSSEGPRGRG